MDNFFFFSVEDMPDVNAKAVFTVDSSSVFKEDVDDCPVVVDENTSYMKWGGDNEIPYHVLDMIEKDETLSTCQMFNAEVCYGNGLVYNTEAASASAKKEVDDFLMDNDLPTYFLGACQDFKHFGLCFSIIFLNAEGNKIVRILRKEACYCRFAPADKKGVIPYILYANWRKSPTREDMEKIPLLDIHAPWADLQERMSESGRRSKDRKFAIVCRFPTPDSTYYPIPYYAALFRGKWYSIKQLIGAAKEAKLKNSAPIKYQIEVSNTYWENQFRSEGVTDREAQKELVVKKKREIIDYLTGAENSGKALFSSYYMTPDGKEQRDIRINKIDTEKEGGDWSTDIQEAVNMFCFTMRVHSNLVGSVPGKSQSNNSGSDKRELYTIAQALQKPYHDLMFMPHRIIIRFNGWDNVFPETPFIQLTTLDENRDAKEVSTERKSEPEP